MIQYFGPWLIAIAAMYPVAFRLAELGGKPVDAVGSDALFLLLLLTPPKRLLSIPDGVDLKKLAVVRVSAIICVAYCLGLSLVGYAASAELSRVVSAVKFVKPMTFVLVGTYLAMMFSPLLLLRRMGTVFAVIVFATIGTAMTHPLFPRCGWGQALFGWETYGYPNTPMTFYGVMVPLLIAAADIERRRILRLSYRIASGIAILLVVASLSRSSTIAMIVAVSFYLFATGRGHLPVMTAITGVVLAAAGVGLMKMETDVEAINFLQGAIDRRLSQTVAGDDPLSGRGNIWLLAIELSSEKPFLGYQFEPFSHYSRLYDTPHQQYLEVQFKTGIIGAAIYLWMLGGGLFGLWHLIGHAPQSSPSSFLLWALLATFVGTLLGNFSQPNLTYSLTGNTVFLMLGVVLNRHGASDLVAAQSVAESLPVAIPMKLGGYRPSSV